MANITASMVKELRERTGLGMMDCKKALSEAGGDMEKAIEDLRKASGLKAAKKASRVAAEGVVLTKIADEGNYGVVIEVNSETDFVARDENFLGFADQVLQASFQIKKLMRQRCWLPALKMPDRRWCRKLVRTSIFVG